jgi:hypothetical protein
LFIFSSSNEFLSRALLFDRNGDADRGALEGSILAAFSSRRSRPRRTSAFRARASPPSLSAIEAAALQPLRFGSRRLCIVGDHLQLSASAESKLGKAIAPFSSGFWRVAGALQL